MADTQPVSIYRILFPHPHLPVKILSTLQDLCIKSPTLHVVTVRAGALSQLPLNLQGQLEQSVHSTN